MKDIPLIDKDYLLQKFPGKGGWTYALIPEVPMEKRFPFGWMKVSGSIDSFILENYKLMPYGNGNLFLPVKAAIRKAISKEAGDTVHIVLFEDHRPQGIPEEVLECLLDAPKAHERFGQLPEWEKKIYIESILAAKNQETKVKRIVNMIEKLDY